MDYVPPYIVNLCDQQDKYGYVYELKGGICDGEEVVYIDHTQRPDFLLRVVPLTGERAEFKCVLKQDNPTPENVKSFLVYCYAPDRDGGMSYYLYSVRSYTESDLREFLDSIGKYLS